MNEFVYKVNATSGPAPVIRKLGALRRGVEQTPIVWKNELLLVTSIGEDDRDNEQCICVLDPETGKMSKPFAEGYYFASAYVENDTLYVFATGRHDDGAFTAHQSEDENEWHDPRGSNTVRMYKSRDLENWEYKDILHDSKKRFWTTSVCKGKDCYMMAVEACAEDGFETEEIGVPFTAFFAKSKDLEEWEFLPDYYSYTPARYNACPTLRYLESDSYYYMVCLESLPCTRYASYIYRTKDFENWEVGIHNPIMLWSDEDRKLYHSANMKAEDIELLQKVLNINCSDMDFYEFEGKTHIFYANGDQMGNAFICKAIYDGGLQSFLQAFFK